VNRTATPTPNEYFEDIENEKDLSIHIVETKKGKFEPRKFEDQYEDALKDPIRKKQKDPIRKKQKGEKIERPKEPLRSNAVSLMDALRQSVSADGTSPRITAPQGGCPPIELLNSA
jgi:DNA end-binding protein Ku